MVDRVDRKANGGFLYTYEAVIAGVALILFVATLLHVSPHREFWSSSDLKEKAYDFLRASDNEGILRRAIVNGEWNLLEYRINQSLPLTMGYRIAVYNETGALLWSYSKGSKDNKDVVVANYIISGYNSTFYLAYITMEAWYE